MAKQKNMRLDWAGFTGGVSSGLEKQAKGFWPEALAQQVHGALPVVSLATVPAAIAAALTARRTREEQDAAGERPFRNIIPGVATYNHWKRMGRTAGEFEERHPGEDSPIVSEYLTALANPLVLGGLGALVGGGIGRLRGGSEEIGRFAPVGAKAGLGVGALGNLLGGVAALTTKTRDAEAQDESDLEDKTLQNLFVPGSASYNVWKRIGRSRAL